MSNYDLAVKMAYYAKSLAVLMLLATDLHVSSQKPTHVHETVTAFRRLVEEVCEQADGVIHPEAGTREGDADA